MVLSPFLYLIGFSTIYLLQNTCLVRMASLKWIMDKHLHCPIEGSSKLHFSGMATPNLVRNKKSICAITCKVLFCITLCSFTWPFMTGFISRTYAAPSDFIIFKMVNPYPYLVSPKILQKTWILHKALPASQRIQLITCL